MTQRSGTGRPGPLRAASPAGNRERDFHTVVSGRALIAAGPTRPVTIVSSVRTLAEIEVETRPAPSRPSPHSSRVLRLLDGSEHPLDGAVLLGRAPRAVAVGLRIVVPDPECGVSRTHARLVLQRGLLTVEDLGSANGTFLVDEDGVETRCPPGEAVPVPLGWGIDLANVPLVLWAPGR